MTDDEFWANSGLSEKETNEAMAAAERFLLVVGYWEERGITSGYPVRSNGQIDDPTEFAHKSPPSRKEFAKERDTIGVFIPRYGSWQSGRPYRLSAAQRQRSLTVSADLTEEELAEVDAILGARRVGQKLTKRQKRKTG